MTLLKRKALLAALAVTVVLRSGGALADEGCAKVTLNAPDNCKELKAEVDLSACDDQLAGTPVVHCRKDGADVRFSGKNTSYVAHCVKTEGAWASTGWEVTQIRKTVPHPKIVAERAAPAPTPEIARTPAGNVPMPNTAPIPAPVATPAAAPSPAPAGLQFNGYFDAYVAHNFNRPSVSVPVTGSTLAAPQNAVRFYDWTSDQLSLSLAELTVKYARKETALMIDLDFGQQADMNAQSSSVTASGGPTPALVDEIGKHLGQAILTYNPSSLPGFVIEAGKMYTHVGLEVPKAKDNWNYSRSSIFSFGLPVWHTGVHAGYAVVPDRLTANVYLYNGWNTLYAVNSSPTYGFQLKCTPSDKIAWVYNYIGGPEQLNNNANWKQVHESNVTWTLSPQLAFAADFVYGAESGVTLLSGNTNDATWGGAQVGSKWMVTPSLSLAPRLEFYRDSQGYTLGGTAQNLVGYTLTPAYQLTDGLEARFELRYDHSSSDSRFNSPSGPTANQATLLLGLLYTF